MKALDNAFGVKKVFMVSLQALSGAGYPGLPSLDIMDNIIPNVGNGGEEDKVEWEPRKMLGKFNNDKIDMANIQFSAHTNRVAVIGGHTVCASVQLAKSVEPEVAIQALREYVSPQSARGLPSSPRPVIEVRDEADRPQPRLDRLTGKGMTTVVGRVRRDPIAGLAGIRDKIEPPPAFDGDIYVAKNLPRVPSSLREATDLLAGSAMLREALGEAVVEHYVHFFRTEQAKFDREVTSWARERYFERA